MDFLLMWELLVVAVWIRVGCMMPDVHDMHGSVINLPRKDMLLLKDEADPKCFTRTEYDFTCFFETNDNKTYDFFYHTDMDKEKRCDISVQRTEEGSFLHICSFPPGDVYMFAPTHLRVLDATKNATLYTRSVNVEDQVLLDPPTNVSLHHTGQPGQLQVEWLVQKVCKHLMHYGIRYSSNRLREKTKEGEGEQVKSLRSLVPGDVLRFQVRVIHILNPSSTLVTPEPRRHWSHWSHPGLAMVPQSAVDISLECYTSDLQNITCQWAGNIYKNDTYKLFYRIGLSETPGWRGCPANGNLSNRCSFRGDEKRVIRVKLGAGPTPGPLDRTFYSEDIFLTSSIKTAPPDGLRVELDGGKLCLSWEVPLPSLSAHLQYQVHYQTRDGGPWLTVYLKGPETETCLEGLTGSSFSLQVRAKPNGTVYSGNWSDWSLKVSGTLPNDIGVFLILFIPLLVLGVAIVFFALIPRYLSKLQKLLWPPIPNLNKVLQGFLAEVNGQTSDPPFTLKQSCEESPASVIEIMYAEETPGESAALFSERGSSGAEQAESCSEVRLDVCQGYVTLSSDDEAPCQKGNLYVHERSTAERTGPGAKGYVCPIAPRCSSAALCPDRVPSSATDIVNRSYLLPAETADGSDRPAGSSKGTDNLYTNLQGANDDDTADTFG